jgi:guanylate kinase
VTRLRIKTKKDPQALRAQGGKIFVISGPSGSGKTTLVSALLSDRDLRGKLVRSISFTTRPRRSCEKDKRDYFFITENEFVRMRSGKKILEWTRYLGYYYGTPRDTTEAYLKQGRSIALCLDFKGARRLKKLYPAEAVTVFVRPFSVTDLSQRIAGRCRNTDKEEIEKRVKLAEKEILQAGKYDYCVVNKKLDVAVKELKKVIMEEIGRTV